MNEFKTNAVQGVPDEFVEVVDEISEVLVPFTVIRILVVVDGRVSLKEGGVGFGVGRMIRLLRESTVGFTRFEVDTARRDDIRFQDGPLPEAPKYRNFRFDHVKVIPGTTETRPPIPESAIPILPEYDEVWCFGWNPGNKDGAGDEKITEMLALPMGDGELRALTEWMNDRRGGLLAMGDHDFIGASMCHRIPRIRSMRRWTNEQGVPPIGGSSNPDTALRHDTLQPATVGQLHHSELIGFANEEDSKPQQISYVPWVAQGFGFFPVRYRPHPILCHPVHGPIDVLPDHPHEGWCFENSEIDITAPINVPGMTGSEYPIVGPKRPRPTVIAHGSTTPNPPYNLFKGASPLKRYAMISVYDGHRVNAGRVATDATWHHWFDLNIKGIEAAGGVNWDKISRYYLNMAIWLAPPGKTVSSLAWHVLVSHFKYPGIEEYSPNASVFDLGKTLYADLAGILGPCGITSGVFERIAMIDEDFGNWADDNLFSNDGEALRSEKLGFLSPPLELIELAVLGGMVRAMFAAADDVRDRIAKDGKFDPKNLSTEELVKRLDEGVVIGLNEVRKVLVRSTDEIQPLISANRPAKDR